MQTQNVQFCLRLNEKVTEEAQHSNLCEHSEGAFSFNLRQKWTFLSTRSKRLEWLI